MSTVPVRVFLLIPIVSAVTSLVTNVIFHTLICAIINTVAHRSNR